MSMKFKMAETTTSRAHVYTLNQDTTKQYEDQKKPKEEKKKKRKKAPRESSKNKSHKS